MAIAQTIRPMIPLGRAGRLAVALLVVSMLGGCQIFGVAAIVAKTIDDARPRQVFAEYPGLEGKSYGLLIAADMSIQAETPGVVAELTSRIMQRLVQNNNKIKATAVLDPADAMLYQVRNPSWQFVPGEELANDLGGLDRIIIIEIDGFRLREPGNRYLWDGEAIANVTVTEIDRGYAIEQAFSRTVRVTFPDASGYSSEDLTAVQVQSVLMQRLSDRIAWLFYDHEEPSDIRY